MGRYDDDNNYPTNTMRQKDLVLSTNEFCFLQDKTSGTIRTVAGPMMQPISQQQALVVFDAKSKSFIETTDFNIAKQLYITAPEGWYITLKNPAKGNVHPVPGSLSKDVEIEVGKKINVTGPCSFPLYPGQMAKAIQGHRLRSNQYLLARVYDADAARKADTVTVDAEGKETKITTEYFVGQLLVIKGTEISFYIPPTGIEVIPVGGKGSNYIRDAITLERLEYAILKDEDGSKRYAHGPAVVFPEPTESFITTPSGGNIFRALELSPISGIYVKVIANYDDEKGVHHPVGEELFITGNDQMIYYPRPEHAMIQYDGKYMHHAIAIPKGEGRYILDRLTGDVKTVVGPTMYLPDPRTEVVVKRKLTAAECELFYPGNAEVVAYNTGLTEKQAEVAARKGLTDAKNVNTILNQAYSTSNQEATLAIFEANSNISRGVSYTKPRTIILDTKYEGVVSIDVWTGYAMQVISRSGKSETIIGPKTRILDYDETLEALHLSTGKPKTTDLLDKTAFLKIKNDKISDLVTVQTKDYVSVQLSLSYCVDFLKDYVDKWFSINNYVKYLCDRMRSLLKREAKKYTIQEFYDNSTDIVRNTVLAIKKDKNGNAQSGMLFTENGMKVTDVEVLNVSVEAKVAAMINKHQNDIVAKSLELVSATSQAKVDEELAKYEKDRITLRYANELYENQLQNEAKLERLKAQAEIAEKERAEKAAITQAEVDMQSMIDEIAKRKLERDRNEDAAKIEVETKLAEIEKAKQEAYAATVEKIMQSVSPDLIAAMTTRSNNEMMSALTKNMSPYALASGSESVTDVTDRLLRGSGIEQLTKAIAEIKATE